MVPEDKEMTRARGATEPETVYSHEHPFNSPGVMAMWLVADSSLPFFFFFFFTFLSTLTITSYHQMGLSPLNPKESHAGLYFLSRT